MRAVPAKWSWLQAASAGVAPHRHHAGAVAAMAEAGIDISLHAAYLRADLTGEPPSSRR